MVSVTSSAEALEAAKGGAHIVDVKNPREGALGANFPRVIREVAKAMPHNVEVSATIGDLPNLPGTASLAALGAAVSGAQYIKAGLYGVRKLSEALNLTREVCKAVKDYERRLKVIAACYADFRRLGSLSPLQLPDVAHRAGADGVMVDVKMKSQEKLFDFLSDADLREFVQTSHTYNLTVALAGSLREEDVSRVCDVGADIIGVRRAVCSRPDRVSGSVQSKAVKEFMEVIRRNEKPSR